MPVLPEGVDWPISPLSGELLHFLFQIDCAALPNCTHSQRELLPRHGVRLFSMPLPPASGVQIGDPTVDMKIPP